MKKKTAKVLKWSLITIGGLLVCIVVLGVILDATTDKTSLQQAPANSTVQRKEVTPDGLFLAINKVRVDNGLEPFKRNALLDKSAGLKCEDMAANHYYEHKNPNTDKSGYSYVEDVGQKAAYVSENLNQGVFTNSAGVVTSWMGSEAHAASILDPRYEEIGFAVCTVDGNVTVVQHKIEPYIAPVQQPQSIRTYDRSYYSPTTTNCTYNDYGGLLSPTMTCKSY